MSEVERVHLLVDMLPEEVGGINVHLDEKSHKCCHETLILCEAYGSQRAACFIAVCFPPSWLRVHHRETSGHQGKKSEIITMQNCGNYLFSVLPKLAIDTAETTY